MPVRFMRKGKSLILFRATIADTTSPYSVTLTEVDDGSAGLTDITPAIAELGGMQYSNDPIETPDLSTTFNTQIPGQDTADPPAFTLYDEDVAPGANLVRTALAKGATGYLILLPYGRVAGRRIEIWPVTSTGVNDEWSAGNDAARYACTFAVTAVPTQNAVYPAV